MNKLRERLINRINQIKVHEQGFDKRTMKWDGVFVGDVHISEVNFTQLADDQLVDIFEDILRQYYTPY